MGRHPSEQRRIVPLTALDDVDIVESRRIMSGSLDGVGLMNSASSDEIRNRNFGRDASIRVLRAVVFVAPETFEIHEGECPW